MKLINAELLCRKMEEAPRDGEADFRKIVRKAPEVEAIPIAYIESEIKYLNEMIQLSIQVPVEELTEPLKISRDALKRLIENYRMVPEGRDGEFAEEGNGGKENGGSIKKTGKE